MKLAKPEPCCFIAVSSPRRCAQTALPGPSPLGRSAEARAAPLEPLVAVAVVVASIVSVFAIVPAVLTHVSAILPDVGLVIVQVVAVIVHVAAVDVEPGIDALCAIEAVIASVPE